MAGFPRGHRWGTQPRWGQCAGHRAWIRNCWEAVGVPGTRGGFQPGTPRTVSPCLPNSRRRRGGQWHFLSVSAIIYE